MLDCYSSGTVNVKQLIMDEFEKPCCIQGYHIHQEVWMAAVGEYLVHETILTINLIML